jgi:methylmalonyl-CoA/ethylmalonyl-CoA epimerase
VIRIQKIDHVAIAVSDIDAALERFQKVLGVTARSRETVANQKTEAALLPIGDSNIELICPKGNEGLQKFLDKRGQGIHHICLRVENLVELLAVLKAAGVPLIDEAPRIGARGHKVAFLHPKALGGVLVELEEP